MTAKTTRLLDRFRQAAIQKSKMGGKDPASWKEIKDEYNEAREKLVEHLEKLEGKNHEDH